MGIAIAISIRLGEGGGKGPQQTATKNGQVEWEVEWEHTSQVEWFGKVVARPRPGLSVTYHPSPSPYERDQQVCAHIFFLRRLRRRSYIIICNNQ